MGTKLFVGNLEFTVTSEELKAHFASAGTVVDAVVISDRETQRSRGFGFVTFEKPEEAQKAIETLNGSDLKGRKINVNEARPMESRPQ